MREVESIRIKSGYRSVRLKRVGYRSFLWLGIQTWLPITKGELVAVLAPFGEYAQAFVLRSLHYDTFKTPNEVNTVTFNTDMPVKITGQKNCNIIFEEGIQINNGSSVLSITNNGINIKSGGSAINMSDSGINLSFGSSTINISDNDISLISGNISTNPPVCKCEGGL